MAALVVPPSTDSYGRPSFFEVYASQHLNSALRPAVRFALDVLSLRHPAYLRPIANRSDGIYTIISLIIEATQLSSHSSLLCESFYSLKRTATGKQTSTSLSRSKIIISLMFDVICPYLRIKLDSLHARQTGSGTGTNGRVANLFISAEDEEGNENEHNHLNLIRFIKNFKFTKQNLLKLYPKLIQSIDITNIIISLLYLYNHTPYFSLSLCLQKLTFQRSNGFDLLRSTLLSSNNDNTSSTSNTLISVGDRLLTALKTAFIGGILAFRFIQYYYAAESSAPRDTSPLLPPPERLDPVEGVDTSSATASGMCPICLQSRVNSTACLSSGYVFCYLCIVAHVQQSNKCPVTFAPTTIEDLVRIYEHEM